LVEKGPVFIKARLVYSARPGDLVLEGVSHGIAHPRPHIIGIGVRVRCNPQRPSQ
jgi:hypothetical protein